MDASQYGHFEIVKILIQNNADTNIQNKVFFINNKKFIYFFTLLFFKFYSIYISN
jgi:hypothetical protein